MNHRSLGLVLLFAFTLLAWLLWPRETPTGAGLRADEATASSAPSAPLATTRSASAPTPEASGAVRTALVAGSRFVVRGRAVSAADTPAPGVRIRARAFRGTQPLGTPVLDAVLHADQAGAFAWELDPPTTLTCFELRGEGERIRSYPETFVLAADDRAPPPFDLFVVPLDALLRGRVLDGDGKPIAGARIGRSVGAPTSDAEGRFAVAVERKAAVRIDVAARGFVTAHHDAAIDVAKGEGETEVRLRAANRIHGRVTDAEQRPLAGATVQTFFTIYEPAVVTDADGRFVLDNLDTSLATHSLFARKTGYVEGKVEVKATKPDVEQDLVLERGVEVRGFVRDAAGKPISAATVFLGFSPSAYDRMDAVSGNDGSFVFPCVAAGKHRLNAERRGLAGKRFEIEVPKPPAPAVLVDVRLDAGHFVGGRAILKDGKPAAGIGVAARLDDDYLEGLRTRTDEQGRFRLDGVPEKELSLEFFGSGVLRKDERVVAIDRGDLEVVLERPGRMAGTVVDGRTGAPIREFRIRFGKARLGANEHTSGGYSASWVRGGKLFHDEHGVFRIEEDVTVGAVFALEASAAGYGATVDDHVVVALDPDPAQLVIALHPGTTIEGSVRERGTGSGVAGARIVAFSEGRPLQPHEPNDEEGRPRAISDASGAFRIENVGPGRVSLAVSHADWLPMTHGPILVAPGAVVPPQTVLLDHGADVIVTVRDADGSPRKAARLLLVGKVGAPVSAVTDASGIARFVRIAPGEHELVLTEGSEAQPVWAFRRLLQVEHEDVHFEFTAKDGDATLVVTIDATEPLPENLQVWITRKDGPATAESPFRVRMAAVQPERTVIQHLPAMELSVAILAGASFAGSAAVTTVAGQSVVVRVPVRRIERGGR